MTSTPVLHDWKWFLKTVQPVLPLLSGPDRLALSCGYYVTITYLSESKGLCVEECRYVTLLIKYIIPINIGIISL
jgi:hypothetical protein